MISVCPVTLREARAWINALHRTHRAPQGGLFAIALHAAGAIVGVAIVGRPTARMLQDDWTAEVTRCCTDGTRNACSMLYGACWRACRAMGYHRLITYTLASEGGSSLRGAGFQLVATVKAESWSRQSRPRIDCQPLQQKLRWQIGGSSGG